MKPEGCSEEMWERALAVQDKAIERCEAEKLAYRFPTCNGKSVLDEEVARALLDAHQRGKDESQAEIDRLNQVIERMQKAMSSQAEQWSRTMAEARREGMEEAASVARCAFDDRPRGRSMDWNDGFDDGTKAAEYAIRAKAKEVKELPGKVTPP